MRITIRAAAAAAVAAGLLALWALPAVAGVIPMYHHA